MVKRAKMIFRINTQGISKGPRYEAYPSYFVEILEENGDSGTYDYVGAWYIEEDNFLNTLLEICSHEKSVDRLRKREPQIIRLIDKIRIRKLHEILE